MTALNRAAPELMTLSEAAALFGVGSVTVRRWCNEGRLSSIRTLGGHRRVYADQVRELLKRKS